MNKNLIKVMLSLTILFLSTLYAVSTVDQAFPVSGIVKNKNGIPIVGATVKLAIDGRSTTTDNMGKFGSSAINLNKIEYIKKSSFIKNGYLELYKIGNISNIKLDIFDLKGRLIFGKYFNSESYIKKIDLSLVTKNLYDGLYFIRLKSENYNMLFKGMLKNSGFTNISVVKVEYTSNKKSNNIALRAVLDTLIVSKIGYITKKVTITNFDVQLEIILDTLITGIPILTVAPDSFIVKNNDTIPGIDLLPYITKSGWGVFLEEGSSPTSVTYDNANTTDYTMQCTIIRKAMSNSEDWQSPFATGLASSVDFTKVTDIVIRYRVTKSTDTVAFFLSPAVNGKITPEDMNGGGYRAVLSKGASKPGEFVTDTLTLSDFSINWGTVNGQQEGALLSNNKSELANFDGIAFANEASPWDEQLNQPTNNGDTIDFTLAGIILAGKGFGKSDTNNDTIVNNYPVHKNILASTFWCGEGASDQNNFITNTQSAWDSHWGAHFGLEDHPTKIARDNDFIPTSSLYTGEENPYYVALPYDDMGSLVYDGENGKIDNAPTDNYGRKESAYTHVYWANEKTKDQWGSNISMCKNRWVRINLPGENRYCYAQWEDAGPYYYNDYNYVFGNADPANTTDEPYAGIDLSPSVWLYLGVSLDDWGTSGEVDWCFVDEKDVPDGPWKKHVTTRQIDWSR